MPRYGPTPPRSLDSLSRPELAARLHVLREATDALQAQRDFDRGECFDCIGKMRMEEQALAHRLGVYGAHGVTGTPGVIAEQIADAVAKKLCAKAVSA